MKIDEILDQLDELLDKAWALPLSGGRCVVDADRVRDLIEDLRYNIPDEVNEAKALVADRALILSEAKKESEMMLQKAQEQAKKLVAQQEIVRQAQAKCADMLGQAKAKSAEMRSASQEFSDAVLRQVEDVLKQNGEAMSGVLNNSLNEIRTTRQALRNTSRR